MEDVKVEKALMELFFAKSDARNMRYMIMNIQMSKRRHRDRDERTTKIDCESTARTATLQIFPIDDNLDP